MSSFDLFGNLLKNNGEVDEPAGHSSEFSINLPEQEDKVEDEHREVRRFTGITILALGIIGLLGVQAFRLQILQRSANQAKAEGNSVRITTIPAARGLIEDFNGKLLAQNTRQLALAINPLTLPADKTARGQVYTALKTKASLDDKTIAFIEDNRRKTPEVFSVKTNLSKEESLLYKEQLSGLPGVVIKDIPVRQYTLMPSLGQLFGYVGPANTEAELASGLTPDQQVGKTGLEQVYNTALSGTPGKERAEVNALGEIVRPLSGGLDSQPKPGDTLKLSIDTTLQQIVADALNHELQRRTKQYGELKNMGASAVVIDPRNGAVRAMVSLPDYDNTLFAQGIKTADYQNLLNNPGNPLLNRAIQGQYPPGSTIKPAIAAGGLQAGVITPNTTMTTPEAIYVGQFRFPDWKVHGLTNVRKAIAESNDIWFYLTGGGGTLNGQTYPGLGIDRLNLYLGDFGLGKPTGIDLPGETDGLLADPTWKLQQFNEQWFIGNTYQSSIGQGYTLTTPLQMANLTAAVANGGTLYKPHLLWSTIDTVTSKETVQTPAILDQNFISPANIKVVQEGMRQTILSGSGRPLNTLKVTSAGKTGTAEFGTNNQTHAWYTGYAPYENPTIAFAIQIEAGGESFYSSLPVAEEILRNYFGDPLAPGQKLNSEPNLANTEFVGEH